jgi:hypothetical protein
MLAVALGSSATVSAATTEDAPRAAVKRLWSPASDVALGRVVLPPPEATPTTSRVAILHAVFEPLDDRASAASFAVAHAGGALSLLPLGAGAIGWTVDIAGDDGVWMPLVASAGRVDGRTPATPRRIEVAERIGTQAALGIADPSRRLDLELPAGDWTVRLRAPVDAAGRAVALVVGDERGDRLVGHLATRVQRPGDPAMLVVRGVAPVLVAVDGPAGLATGDALDAIVDRATIEGPDGVARPARVLRESRGWRLDGPALGVGRHLWRVEARVLGGDGRWRARTLDYLVETADGPAVARGEAQATLVPSTTAPDWLDLAIPLDAARPGEVVFAAAELWSEAGGDPASATCLGWLGGLAEVADDGAVRLGLSCTALGDAPPQGLALRQVRLHARDGWTPLDLVGRLPVAAIDASAIAASARRTGATPRRRVLEGGVPGTATVPTPPRAHFARRAGATPGSHALLVSHGYCANENTFPVTHFEGDTWWYLRANVNLTHDAFALDLAAEGERFKSYGIVGHSQGGLAAVHLHAFYWSGLDWAGPGRLVQTLGSPFEGTPLAGNIAALGEIFGIQCGANAELTYDGAAAWLSTIPSWVRARVYTHTTTFEDFPFFYDYCSIASDFFLSDPEDGVVEHWSGHIPGANDMGLREGWCHVPEMRDPDQATDAARNATMDQEAAR